MPAASANTVPRTTPVAADTPAVVRTAAATSGGSPGGGPVDHVVGEQPGPGLRAATCCWEAGTNHSEPPSATASTSALSTAASRYAELPVVAAASRPVAPSARSSGPATAAVTRISSGARNATATTSVNTVPTAIPAASSPLAWAETTHSVTPPASATTPSSSRGTPGRRRSTAVSASASAGPHAAGRRLAIQAATTAMSSAAATATTGGSQDTRSANAAGTMPRSTNWSRSHRAAASPGTTPAAPASSPSAAVSRTTIRRT